jgi:hypothetical protein
MHAVKIKPFSNYYLDDLDDHLEVGGEYRKWEIRNAYKIFSFET